MNALQILWSISGLLIMASIIFAIFSITIKRWFAKMAELHWKKIMIYCIISFSIALFCTWIDAAFFRR